MARKKVHKVSAMRINEVSLVDLPANAGSTVVLMKRDDTRGPAPFMREEEGMDRTLEELAKALEDASEEIAELKKRAEAAEAERDALKDGDKQDEDDEQDEDAVTKALPEPVRKQFADLRKQNEEMAAALAKQAEERETAEWIQKAAALSNITGTSDEIGSLLYRVAKGITTAEDADGLLKTLTGANAASAALMAEAGKVTSKPNSADAAINKRAEELRKSDSSLTPAQAVSKVLADDPELYTRYLQEQAA